MRLTTADSVRALATILCIRREIGLTKSTQALTIYSINLQISSWRKNLRPQISTCARIRGFTHHNMCQVIFIDLGNGELSMRISKIPEESHRIKGLFVGLTVSYQLHFGGCLRDDFSQKWAPTHYDSIAFMRATLEVSVSPAQSVSTQHHSSFGFKEL